MANTETSPDSILRSANSAIQRGDEESAVAGYVELLRDKPRLRDQLGFDLSLARWRYRYRRLGHTPRVAVCGWELSHNSAGRVRALADILADTSETEIIGPTFPKWGNSLWAPLRDCDLVYRTFHVESDEIFPSLALDFVRQNPYDVVVLSKPRMPNILMGLLYKMLWDAWVILDIDDEELGIIKADSTLKLEELAARQGERLDLSNLTGKEWTRAAVEMWDLFDDVTVSNEVLQRRYGGTIIPHARDANVFTPSAERRSASRQRFGIPQDRKVVLFNGTPRRHKGLLEIAKAVAELRREDLCLVVVGDFSDEKLKAELEAIKELELYCLPGQPYSDLPNVVAVGDICVLMQQEGSELAQFQIPAKLTDALAMELTCFAQPTPALQAAIEGGAVVPFDPGLLKTRLAEYLNAPGMLQRQAKAGRSWFEAELSLDRARETFRSLLPIDITPAPLTPADLTDARQQQIFETLGGWDAFTRPVALPALQLPLPADGRRTIVYSVLVGNYEDVKEPAKVDPRARYILFTDNPALRSENWEIVVYDTLGLSPRRASRLPKMLPHRYLPDHDVSIYIDASLTMVEADIPAMTNGALDGQDIAAYPHSERTCSYEEIEACLHKGKTTRSQADIARRRLEAEGHPRQYGLLENALIVRRDTPAVRRVGERWYAMYSDGAERDQFYLMHAIRTEGVKVARIANSKDFRKSPHVKFRSHSPLKKVRSPAAAGPRHISWNRSSAS